jgi:hypothetical protein
MAQKRATKKNAAKKLAPAKKMKDVKNLTIYMKY